MFEVELDRYKEHFNNDFEYLNYVISLKFEVLNSYKSYSKDKLFIDQSITLIESSLKLEPSLSNKAWFYKINALYFLYKISSSADEKDKIKKNEILMNIFLLIHPSISLTKINIQLVIYSISNDKITRL